MRWRRNQVLLVGASLVSAAIAVGIVPLASAPAGAASSNPEIPVTAPAPAQPPGPPPAIATLEAEDLATINAERAAAGSGPVAAQAWAASEAETLSLAMAAQATIFHDMSGFMADGHDVLGAIYLGENVAMDSTLASAEQLLFNDPAHRAILLDSRYNYVGIGAAYDGRNWVYLTENFAEIPGAAVRLAAPPAATTIKPSAPKPAAVVAAPKPAAPVPAAVAHPAAPAVVPAVVPAVAATPAAPATSAPPAQAAAKAPAPARSAPASAAGALSTRPVSSSSHLPLWMMTVVMAVMSMALGGAAVVQMRAGARGHAGSVWQSPSLAFAVASAVTNLRAGRAGRAGRQFSATDPSCWQPTSHARSYR